MRALEGVAFYAFLRFSRGTAELNLRNQLNGGQCSAGSGWSGGWCLHHTFQLIFSEVSLVVERYLLNLEIIFVFLVVMSSRALKLGDDFFARDGPGSCLETLRVIRETCGT